eukprot:67905-Alexandrium_andersonii.AAC.1
MSASLVGSEMCIRDRSTLRMPAGLSAKGTQECKNASTEARKQGSKEAVSYTHLTLPTICSV